MIEITVKNFLSNRLDAPVFMEMPQNASKRFVILRKADSGKDNFLDDATFIAESYGKSLLEAAELNESVKRALDDLVQLPSISASRRGGDYPAFDTTHKRYRYQAVQNITFYEE